MAETIAIMRALLEEVRSDIATVGAADFVFSAVDARTIPAISDVSLTFDDFDTRTKKCKTISTCVLFIDLRDSTEMSQTYPLTLLAKAYSCFIRAVVRSADIFQGEVREIAGDRVLIVFPADGCFQRAVHTSFLLNSTMALLREHFPGLKAGIGIHYGQMLVMKAGVVRQGKQSDYGKSLIWLGPTMNIASKLTNHANTETVESTPNIFLGFAHHAFANWTWKKYTVADFVKSLNQAVATPTVPPMGSLVAVFESVDNKTNSTASILVSNEVLAGFLSEVGSNAPSFRNSWWSKQSVKIEGYEGKVWGCDVSYILPKQ